MKATYIPVNPPTHLNEANPCVSLEPEVLAACLARYSRSNEGIGSILEKYGDKSPAAVFKFIDYGHASIGGLTGGIAIAIDNVSMLAALKLFEFSQMADGQESSTRYIELQPSGVLTPEEIGVNDPETAEMLKECISLGFEIYRDSLKLLEKEVSEDISIARIPPNTPEKTAQRMLKNYGLDRCRYFLPMCAKTNLALVMSARSWAQTLKELQSLPWKETQQLSNLIRTELNKAAPDLIRHSFPDKASMAQIDLKIEKTQNIYTKQLEKKNQLAQNTPCECETSISNTSLPPWEKELDFTQEVNKCFEGKENRYSFYGDHVKRMTTHTTWSAMALAEVRDLNRHRTGFRAYHSIPVGFYMPEEIEDLRRKNQSLNEKINSFLKKYKEITQKAISHKKDHKHKDYFFFLGTQVPFEHCQQLDKFIYESELRTGLGAHFKYAEHLKKATQSLLKKMPTLEKFIQIGTAEPE